MAQSMMERFLAKVDRSGGKDSCWLWTAGKDRRGYGRIGNNKKKFAAHRVAYELFVGKIPAGLQVHHTCHKGHLGCVNPHHLKVGTNQQNIDDKIKAGRQPRGGLITTEDIASIEQWLQEGLSYAEIADRMNRRPHKR